MLCNCCQIVSAAMNFLSYSICGNMLDYFSIQSVTIEQTKKMDTVYHLFGNHTMDTKNVPWLYNTLTLQ